jgi:hypothetical protein
MMPAVLVAMMLRRARRFGLAATSDVGGRRTGVGILIWISGESSPAGRGNTARRAAAFSMLTAAGSATRSPGISGLRVRYKKT